MSLLEFGIQKSCPLNKWIRTIVDTIQRSSTQDAYGPFVAYLIGEVSRVYYIVQSDRNLGVSSLQERVFYSDYSQDRRL